jgi:hypothetical protein
MNNNTDVNGNKDVIGFLQNCLETAKRDGFGYAVVSMAKDPGQYLVGFSGTVELESKALEGIKSIIPKIETNLDNRQEPFGERDVDASHVCYNCTKSPISFDFITWMMDAEMNRIRAGAPGPLKIGFWFGKDGKTGIGGSDSRERFLDNVCRPAMALIGAVEDPKAVYGKFKEFFSFRDITEGSRKGEAVPKFKAPPSLRTFPPGYVTITLREAEYWPHRNSKIKEWVRFARYLQARGERVIFVRDTAKAKEPFLDFTTCPEASLDLTVRCALYRDAKCNLFVSNGPVVLNYFMDTPFLQFLDVDENGAYNAERPQYWEQCVGIKPGEQIPWFNDKQRIVWKPDYFTNLVLAWDDLYATRTLPAVQATVQPT